MQEGSHNHGEGASKPPAGDKTLRSKIDDPAADLDSAALKELATTPKETLKEWIREVFDENRKQVPDFAESKSLLDQFDQDLDQWLSDKTRPENEHDTLVLVLRVAKNDQRTLKILESAKPHRKVLAGKLDKLHRVLLRRKTLLVANARPENEHDTLVGRVCKELVRTLVANEAHFLTSVFDEEWFADRPYDVDVQRQTLELILRTLTAQAENDMRLF